MTDEQALRDVIMMMAWAAGVAHDSVHFMLKSRYPRGELHPSDASELEQVEKTLMDIINAAEQYR